MLEEIRKTMALRLDESDEAVFFLDREINKLSLTEFVQLLDETTERLRWQ